MLFVSVDMLDKGAWNVFKELDDPELKDLAKELPMTVMSSRASSTTSKYLRAFRRWKEWANSHKLTSIPAAAHHIALYLQYIAKTTTSKATAEEAVYAIAWAHSLAGLPSPTETPLVQTTLQGLCRLLAKPIKKKEPMTVEMLQAMVRDVDRNETLTSVRLATACLLAFAGFLRFDELIHIRCCDLTVDEKMLKIQIPRSKTDQLRKGDEVIIARSLAMTCPVRMLERYIRMANIRMDSELFLFRQITKSKKGESLRDGGAVSYTTMRELFKKKVKELGYPADVFGLHSLRAGGASAAANAGVSDRLFKRHGRWRSDNAKDGYVEDSLDNRLSVTRRLGI